MARVRVAEGVGGVNGATGAHRRLDSAGAAPNNAGRDAMATVRITYWRDIPVLVTARDRDGEVTVPLSQRFQDLVDAVAMLSGLGESEAYLAQWRTGPEEDRGGSARAAAAAVAAGLEERFDDVRAQSFRPGGPFDAH
jgi:hypothetical protein